MKKIFLILLLFSGTHLFSQIYPFADGFEGQPSNQPPVGWGGSMKVLLNHGLNDLKAVCARVSSAVTVDSAITPLIGPLTSSSAFSFYYRIIDQANYPSTPTNLDVNSQVEIMLSTDSVNYQTVYLIDLNNHNPSFNFVKRKAYLTQFAGQTVNFKIRCQYGGSASFFVDIDTIDVQDEPQTGIENINSEGAFEIFPNPISQSSVAAFQIAVSPELIGEEYTLTGIRGNLLEKGRISTSNFKLQTSNLAAGLYFVQAGTLTRKLIIE